MEDDEEIQSHTSHETEEQEQDRLTKAQSPSSEGISVTVATAAPPPPPAAILTLALPIQNHAFTPAVVGGGREDCWSERATSVLIDAWGERYTELSRGNLKQKHWKEVADIVNSMEDYGKTPKTDMQCKNRIDTVKKKYKIEKSKVSSGCGPSQWLFYERLDRLIGPSISASTAKGSSVADEAVPVGIPVGVRQQPRPLPFPTYTSPHLQPPPHFQSPSPQQPIRHNFPTPISQQPRFNHHNYNNVSPVPQGLLQMTRFNNHGINHNHNYSSNVSVGNVGSSTSRQHQAMQFRRGVVESEEEEEGWSNDSGDSLPPETRKRPRGEMNVGGGVRKGKGKKALKVWGNSVRELTRAILKFGEAYEMAESAKLEHIVEMEKERMKFAKELELQRMKFLMKTQLEISQFNSDSRGGESSGKRGGGGGGLESNHLH